VTGGGSRSELWCRIVAAAADRPVRLGIHPDAAALGAAIQAAWVWERQRQPERPAADVADRMLAGVELRTLSPQSADAGVYARRRRAYETLVASLAPCFRTLGQP
jgi:sugar (pentulose or hexulose) kinase